MSRPLSGFDARRCWSTSRLGGLALLLVFAWPRTASAATTPRIAVVQCVETREERWHASHSSSQSLVGLAVLLGVHYETLLLEELLDRPAGSFTGLWFSSCLWVDEDNYDGLVPYLEDHVAGGGSVFLDGPLGAYYHDDDGDEHRRGMDELAPILGVDWDGWRSTVGYDVATTTSLHPVAARAGYGLEVELADDLDSGTDILEPADPTAQVLLEVVSPFDGNSYPFLVVAESVPGSKVAAIGSYGSSLGVASPFRNDASPAYSDNQVLPYLLETLIWTTAHDDEPYAGLQISHAPVTIVGRLDGDWSDEADATESTLDYLIGLSAETGIATVYAIVSEFAEEADVWPVFAALGPSLQALGGSIGTHSRTHPFDASNELDSAGWEAEVAGSLQEIRDALTTGGFAPDAYAFVNPGNTIRTEHYGEFFDDIELYMSHGFEGYTPYSSGVQGFGLPPGVPPRATINNVLASDYRWFYSSSWVYTVDEAATYQAAILDYYEDTVGRGVIYNLMWHDYALGGGSPPEHYPDSRSTLPMFETTRDHFWSSQVYAPTIAEVTGKLYVSQGTVITSSYSGDLEVDLDYSEVPARHRAHVAGMGLRIHQQEDPIRRVVIDGTEHYAFTRDTIMLPAPAGPTQHVVVELGPTPEPVYRLEFASKPVSSARRSGSGVAATLAQPGFAMKFCFAGPSASVVLGASEYEMSPGGDACGSMLYGNPQPALEIQPFDTGGLDVLVRRATRPLADAYLTAGGIHLDAFAGGAAVIELESPRPPAQVVVDGAVVAPTITGDGFAVHLPTSSSPASVDISFVDQPCEVTEATEVSCDDGHDNDCDGRWDCADGDCSGVGSCNLVRRVVVVSDVSDATVRATAPASNFGSADSLEIDTASVHQYALIKPDNLGDIAPGAQLVRAELVFQIFNPGDPVELREVLSDWSEADVTWNSAPLAAADVYRTIAGAPAGEVVIDITPIARDWVGGGSIRGLELAPTDTDGVDLYSSEHPTSSLRPYFVFEVIEDGGVCPDDDGDGHLAGFCGGDDCDDADPGAHPGAAELCDDGRDNDCDGAADCADGDCAGTSSCVGAPRVVVVSEVSDATVRETAPTSNFGSGDALEIDTASVYQYALIKPDDLGDIAQGALVVRAELVFQIFNPGDTVEVRQVLGDWSEAAVTWNTAPLVAPNAYRTEAGSPVGEVVVDIAAIAQGWIDGAAVHGLALTPTGTDGVDIHSSEYATSSLRPYFVFEVIDGGGACPDGDGDSYLASSCGGDDCDDADPGTHPGAAELCDDGLDNDCDTLLDCADDDCAAQPVCTGGGVVVTVVLHDLDDAYVSDQSPNTGFGDRDSLEVDTWSEYKVVFIKPNGLGGIATGAQVVSAQLVLHVHGAGDAVMLREVLSDWSEAAITWATAPSAATAFASIPAGAIGDAAIDVTELVQQWVDGGAVHGLLLEPTSSDGVDIRSTEFADAAYRPRFVVEVVQ